MWHYSAKNEFVVSNSILGGWDPRSSCFGMMYFLINIPLSVFKAFHHMNIQFRFEATHSSLSIFNDTIVFGSLCLGALLSVLVEPFANLRNSVVIMYIILTS